MSFSIDNDPQCSVQSLFELESLDFLLEEALFSKNLISQNFSQLSSYPGTASSGDHALSSTSSKVSQASKRKFYFSVGFIVVLSQVFQCFLALLLFKLFLCKAGQSYS